MAFLVLPTCFASRLQHCTALTSGQGGATIVAPLAQGALNEHCRSTCA